MPLLFDGLILTAFGTPGPEPGAMHGRAEFVPLMALPLEEAPSAQPLDQGRAAGPLPRLADGPYLVLKGCFGVCGHPTIMPEFPFHI